MTIDQFGLYSPLALLRNMGINPDPFSQRVASHHGASTGTDLDLFSVFSMAELAAMLERGQIPMDAEMPPPSPRGCQCPQHYARDADQGFAGMEQMMPSPEMLLDQGRSAMFMEFLRTNPHARQQIEMMLGGQILPGHPSDMAFQLAPFTMGAGMIPGMPSNPAYAHLAMMQQEAAFMGFMAGSAFQGAMLSALMQAAMPQARAAKKKKKKKPARARANGARRGQASRGANRRPVGAGGGGGGRAQFQSGRAGPYQGAFGLGRGNGDEITNVLNDPTLTVEDKVTLMIMLIMKKMDKDIEKQAQEINKLQQQQSNGGNAGGGQGGLQGAPSIDVETMKLKRLIDKRSQMFDMLRQIIDKYNQTAKGIIDSISR